MGSGGPRGSLRVVQRVLRKMVLFHFYLNTFYGSYLLILVKHIISLYIRVPLKMKDFRWGSVATWGGQKPPGLVRLAAVQWGCLQLLPTVTEHRQNTLDVSMTTQSQRRLKIQHL